MGDYAYIYQSIHSFEPVQNSGIYLGFQKGDTFEISASSPYGQLRNPNLLFAYNRRTGATGYVRRMYSFFIITFIPNNSYTELANYLLTP